MGGKGTICSYWKDGKFKVLVQSPVNFWSWNKFSNTLRRKKYRVENESRHQSKLRSRDAILSSVSIGKKEGGTSLITKKSSIQIGVLIFTVHLSRVWLQIWEGNGLIPVCREIGMGFLQCLWVTNGKFWPSHFPKNSLGEQPYVGNVFGDS